MPTMIEIDDGIFVNPCKVTLVKAVTKKKSVLYVDGQSALDGFVLQRNALKLAQEIVDGMNEENEEQDEDEEDEEQDEEEEDTSSSPD